MDFPSADVPVLDNRVATGNTWQNIAAHSGEYTTATKSGGLLVNKTIQRGPRSAGQSAQEEAEEKGGKSGRG